MKVKTNRGLAKKLVCLLFALIFACSMMTVFTQTSYAAVGDTPPHTKTLTDNHDGTYTIALDVVGESEKKPNNVNVVVIFDKSGSMNNTRMTAAKNAVNSLADKLYAYNTTSEPNIVQMALVDFSTHASTAQAPTNSSTTFKRAVNNLSASGGTNWEAALKQANSVNFGDDDQTFVIFVSDGNPTFRDTQGTTRITDNRWYNYDTLYYDSEGVYGLGSDNPNNTNYSPQSMGYCYNHAVDDATTLVNKVGADHFFTIGAFGNAERMKDLTDDAGSNSDTNYYAADDTAALNQAISDILAKIEMSGIANTEIDDGTTNQVTTTSGEVAELLEVDTSSYKYYRSNGSYGTMQPWADAPPAEFVNGTVEWDLSSVGVLENGVRYTVTFDCYPSQYTYDTIAKLKNGDISYTSLDANVKQYIVDNGGGNYSLRTNTNATLSYDDTRDEAGQQTRPYTNPDPVATAADTLPIEKKWEGAKPDVDSVPITVMMGEEEFHTATLTKENNWKTNTYISVGIIKNGQALPGAEGHDFSFAELDDTQYRWEIDAPTVRPMLINGGGNEHTPTMLIKVDDKHPVPSGAQTYTIGGATYYVDAASAGLTATNYRRSNLNLRKTVTGNEAPEDALFPFTLTVNNSKAPTAEPENDPKHGSDYWVWFSIFDTKANANVKDAEISGATLSIDEGTGDYYYYAPSGSPISVKLKDGWNLRFTNLPSGSTYTLEEGTMPAGFEFKNAELTDGTDTSFSGGKKTTGTIADTGTAYAVNYSNQYNPVKAAPKVTKAVTGRDAAEAFNFSIEAGDDATAQAIDDKHIVMPTNKTVTTGTGMKKGETKELSFDDITFYREGTYTFTVKETNANQPAGWTYANKAADAKTITVKVEADSTGKLTATLTGDKPTFTNSYVAEPTSAQIPVLKNVTPDEGLKAPDITGKFTFTLAPVGGAPMPTDAATATVVSGKSGEVVKFPAINYTEAGTYQYTITESVTEGQSAGGVELETDKPKNISVVVTDNGEGQLVAVVNGNPETGKEQPLEFNNPYHVTATNITIPVEKSFTVEPEGAVLPDMTGKFTFTLATTDNAPLPDKTTLTNPSATGGNMTFGDKDTTGEITINGPGTYTYTITESGDVDGVTLADPATQTVVVTVTDKGDGTLDVKYDKSQVSFDNTYTVQPTTASIPVEKLYDVAADLKDTAPSIKEKFTFTLKAGSNTAPEGTKTPMPATTSHTNPAADGGNMSFGTIEYTLPGVYTYTVTETGSVTGVSPVGTTEKTVEVVVTDNKNGTLTATVNEGKKLQFTNEYKVNETTAKIPVNKILKAEGLSPDSIEGKFTFTLTPVNGAPIKDKDGNNIKTEYTNPAPNGGKVEFGDIVFTNPGTYTYTVTETGSAPGVKNDTQASKEVKIVVTDKGDGNLEAVVNDGKDVEFTNTYNVSSTKVSFPAKKELSLPAGTTGPDITGKYTIKLAGTDSAPMPEVTSYTNPDSDGGTVTFGEITYTKPGTYTYTVSEEGRVAGVTNDSAAAGKTVTVTVEDNGDGTMTATADSTTDNPVKFTNTYSYGTITATPAVNKTVSRADGTTPPDITEKYTFTLSGKNGAPMPEEGSEVVKNPAADGGTVSFGTITFSAPGTYEYEVTEAGSVKGITNDTVNPKSFTIKVTDNKDGTLSAAIDYGNDAGHVIFDNPYKVEPTTAEIPVEKILEVPEGLKADSIANLFTFTLSAEDGTPMPAKGEEVITNPDEDGGEASFGTITYNKPGTYTYTVTETGSAPGVTNDKEATKTVTVVVADNHDGTMTATVNGGKKVQFTNKYSVEPTKIKIPAKKVLKVDEGLNAPDITGKYTFTLAGTGSAPMPEVTSYTNPDKDGGSVSFGDITFTAPGEYTYNVTESGTVKGVTNDSTATKQVKVKVTDNGDGTMTAEITDGKDLTFTNTYGVTPTTAKFPVEKILEYKEGLKPGSIAKLFTFTLTAKTNGAPMPGTTSYTNPDADGGTVSFGDITYTAPGTYEYNVTETGTAPGVTNDQTATKVVTVKVVDNGDGTLTATPDYNDNKPLQFINKYDVEPTTIEIPAEKILEVPEGLTAPDITGKFTFTLDGGGILGIGGSPMPNTKSYTNPDADGGTVTFGGKDDPITFTEPGEYKYTVKEEGEVDGITNDPKAEKDVVVKVTDNGDGTLSAEITTGKDLTFTNAYSVKPTTAKIPIEKILEVGEGLKAPDITDQFTFTLTSEDGTPMPKVTEYTNPKADGGEMSFGDIEFTKPGNYTYTITETGEVKGVTAVGSTEKTVSIAVVDNSDGTLTATVGDGETLTFTNQYKVEEVDVEIPATKILEVPEGLTPPDITGKYTFTLAAVDGATIKDKDGKDIQTEYTNPDANGGTVTFGKIHYTKPGTYTYTVTESGKVDGIENDKEATKTVEVVVTDNSDGSMTVVVNGGEDVKFTNKYDVEPTTAKIPVEKILESAEGLTPDSIKDKYTFTLTAEEGTPMPKVTEYTNPDADGGSISFGDIEYTKPGTYTYTVTETGKVDGITNDKDASKTVTVSVVDNSDGTMTATVNNGETLQFTNTYEVEPITAEIPVEKILEVPEGLDGPDSIQNAFTFELTAEDGTPMPDVTSYTNPDADGGEVKFGTIKFTKPGTYTYTVTESGKVDGVTNDKDAAKEVKIVVKDNGDGTMTATVNDGKTLEFTNKYDVEPTTAVVPVEKILKKADDSYTLPEDVTEKFTFEISANKDTPDAPLPEVTSKKNPDKDGGSVSFGDITFKAPGTYKYDIKESGTVAGVTNAKDQTIEIVVTDEKDGTLKAVVNGDAAIEFENVYKPDPIDIGIPVEKILSPGVTTVDITEEFTFTLEPVDGAPITDKDGKEIGTIKNPDKTGGSATFDAIHYTLPGEYKYIVRESGEVKGVTNDYDKNVTVIVTDDGSGKLTAKVQDDEEAEKVTFTNEYDAKGDIVLDGTKTFKYGNLKDKEFTFTVLGQDESGEFTKEITSGTTKATGTDAAAEAVEGAVDQVKADAEGEETDASKGKIYFGKLEYTLDDLKNEDGTYAVSKTFEYIVKEVITDDEDVIFDTSEKKVKVTVTDNGDGTLTCKVADGSDDIDFVNQKKYLDLQIIKNLEDYIDHGEQVTAAFAFKIVGTKDGKEVFNSTAGLEFGKDDPSQKKATVDRIPTDAKITVTEIYSGNYKPDDAEFVDIEIKEVSKEDGVYCYEVTFTNTKDTPPYSGGAVNRYTQTDEGVTYKETDGKAIVHRG